MPGSIVSIVRRGARGRIALASGVALVLVACDGGSSGLDPAGDAVLTGSVQEAPGTWGGAAGASAPAPTPGPATTATAEVRTAAAGYVRGNGSFEVLAEAQVEADGRFRIEGVPAGRSDLVVQARGEGGASLGEALVWEETRSGAESAVPPITARSTTEARVEARLRATGRLDPTTRAELALLMALEAGAGASATSATRIEALADALAEARAAFGAHLSTGTGGTSAQARAEASADARAAFASALSSGVDLATAHRAYVRAIASAWATGDDQLELLVFASAAASQRLAAVVVGRLGEDAEALASVRSAFLANIELRTALAESRTDASAGLRAAALAHLEAARGRIASATTLAELRSALAAERSGLEGRVSASVLGALGGTDLDLLGLVDARVRTAVAQAAFWTRLEGAADAQATVEAATSCRADLEAAVAAWIEALPASIEVDSAVAFRLFLALGGGAPVTTVT